MGKILLKLIKWSSSISDKVRMTLKRSNKRDDGRFADPSTLTKIFKYYIPIFLIVLVVGRILTSDDDEKMFNKFESETKTELPVGKGITSNPNDMYSLQQQNADFANSLQNKISSKGAISRGFSQTPNSTSKVPNKFECNELLSKVSRGEILEGEEKSLANNCLDNNVLGMTQEQKKAASMAINDDTLPPEARKQLAQFSQDTSGIDGALSESARNLMSSDPIIAEAARKALDMSIPEEDRKKYALIAEGKLPKSDIAALNKKNDERIAMGVQTPSDTSSGSSLPGSLSKSDSPSGSSDLSGFSGSTGASGSVSGLAQEIREIQSQKDEADQSQKEAEKQLGEAIKNQRGVSEKSKVLADISSKSKQLDAVLEVKKLRFRDLYKNASKDLLTVKAMASGKSAESMEEIAEEEVIPEFAPRKTKSLTEDELRLLALFNESDPSNKRQRRSIDISNYPGIEMKGAVANNAFHSSEVKTNIQLSPSVKIAAVMEDDTWVSEKNYKFKQIRARLRQDATEAETGKKILFKDSILIGNITSFDADSKSVFVTFNKAQVGGKTIDISITTQVMGDILDTRGRQITAALLTDFAGAITEKIKKDADTELTETVGATVLNTANTAGVGLLSSGAQKISQIIANDLQNASRIFFSPRGVKLNLYP